MELCRLRPKARRNLLRWADIYVGSSEEIPVKTADYRTLARKCQTAITNQWSALREDLINWGFELQGQRDSVFCCPSSVTTAAFQTETKCPCFWQKYLFFDGQRHVEQPHHRTCQPWDLKSNEDFLNHRRSLGVLHKIFFDNIYIIWYCIKCTPLSFESFCKKQERFFPGHLKFKRESQKYSRLRAVQVAYN